MKILLIPSMGCPEAKMWFKPMLLVYLLWISNFITCMVINAKVIVEFNSSMKYLDDEEAKFGESLPESGIGGYLVVANPLNACAPIKPPPKGYLFKYVNFFALIKESDCDFSHQVFMAQEAKYAAAIIYLKDSETPLVMSGRQDASKVTIPSVNVGRSGGNYLKKFDYKTQAHIYLQPSVKVPIELYLVPFIVVFGVCFLFMVIFSVVRFYRNRRSLQNSRLSKENLKSIPTKKFKKGDEYDVCAICLEEFEVGDKLRVLPCNHVYHCKCIDPWLTGGKKSCPVCNRPVIVARKHKSRQPNSAPSTSSTGNSPPPDDENEAQSEMEQDEDINERTPLISGSTRRPRGAGAMDV